MWSNKMNLEQIKLNWQKQLSSSSEAVKPQAEIDLAIQNNMANNMNIITNKMLAIDKKAKERTLYGIIGFSIIICALSALNYLMFLLSQSMFAIAGTTTWIVWFVVSIFRLVKFKHKTHDNSLCIKSALESKLNKVNKEIKYYQTLVYWVLAPMSVGMILILIGSQALIITFISFFIFWVLGMYCANKYNLRYIDKSLKPIKQEITESLASLT